MKKLQINIFTTDLVWMGAIDAIESLIHRTSWHEIPSSELVISKHAQGVEELQVGRILLVNNQKDKALIIEDMAAALDSEYITYSLLSLKGLMNYRICHPTYANNFVQRRQSEVMQILAYNNLINQSSDNDRKFMDSTNTRNMFIVTELKLFGDTIDFTIDWKTGFLGDTITTVAKMYGINTTAPLGWNVIVNSTNTSFILDVYHGTHKHINQTEYSPVIFSEEFGNIQNATYEYSIKEWRNAAYVSWTDADNVARVNWIGNDSKGITRSFNRKEVLLQSSKKTSAEIEAEGRSELNKRPHIENFTAEIIDTDKTLSTYGADWQLGDIVTVQSKSILKDRLISIDAQITEIEEIYSEGQYSINATFGEGRLSVFQLIKQSIEQKK